MQIGLEDALLSQYWLSEIRIPNKLLNESHHHRSHPRLSYGELHKQYALSILLQ